MRCSKNQIQARFEIVAKALGWNYGPAYEPRGDGTMRAIVGATYLDYYNGWAIERISNESGGTRNVTSWGTRYTASEMVAWLDGAYHAATQSHSAA